MQNIRTKEVDELFDAILLLKDREECYKFFKDVLTIKEILDTAQRLKAAKMLRSNCSYIEVCQETGMSTATVSRVSKCLEKGAGGYNIVLDRLGIK